MDVDGKANGRALFSRNVDIRERGGAGDIDSRWNEEAARDGKRLDGLVDRTRSNALHVDGNPVLYHAGYGPGDGRRG